MSKIETHYTNLSMGETPINGVFLESKCKLDDAFNAVTGIDVESFYTNNTTGAVVEANKASLLTVRDKTTALITDVLDEKLSHSKDLKSNDRFMPIEVEAISNELVVIFRSAHGTWKEGHTFHSYVTLRYE